MITHQDQVAYGSSGLEAGIGGLEVVGCHKRLEARFLCTCVLLVTSRNSDWKCVKIHRHTMCRPDRRSTSRHDVVRGVLTLLEGMADKYRNRLEATLDAEESGELAIEGWGDDLAVRKGAGARRPCRG